MRAVVVIGILCACSFRTTIRTDDASDGDAMPDTATDAVPITPKYYVDFAGGDDAGDGLSTATAWKHAPGDSLATLTPAAVVLEPGDVILFKGGVVYEGHIAIKHSGAAGNPIMYTGHDEGLWGTGRAVIDGQQLRRLGISVTMQSHVRIDGFRLERFNKQMSPLAVAVDTSDHVEVSRNQIRDVYYPTNPTPLTMNWAAPIGVGIYVRNSSDVVVQDNTIRDVGYGGIAWLAFSGTMTGGVIAGNDVTNMNRGIVVETPSTAAVGTRIVGLKIERNYIHDFDQYLPNPQVNRLGIEVNALPVTTGQGSIEGVEIARNYFETDSLAGGSLGWIFLDHNCTGFEIHHNVLHRSPHFFAIRVFSNPAIAGNHVIASNTIANHNASSGVGMHVDGSTGMQITNNIFYCHHEGYQIATSAMAGFTADYNLFYRLETLGGAIARLDTGPANNPAGTHCNLAELQARGFEANGRVGDPLFSIAFDQINSNATGFAPTVGSPATDTGAATAFDQDFGGGSIPIGAGPDIGAFEAH